MIATTGPTPSCAADRHAAFADGGAFRGDTASAGGAAGRDLVAGPRDLAAGHRDLAAARVAARLWAEAAHARSDRRDADRPGRPARPGAAPVVAPPARSPEDEFEECERWDGMA